MALNQRSYALFFLLYKLIPQLIQFHALGGTGFFISGIVNSIINSVVFILGE